MVGTATPKRVRDGRATAVRPGDRCDESQINASLNGVEKLSKGESSSNLRVDSGLKINCVVVRLT